MEPCRGHAKCFCYMYKQSVNLFTHNYICNQSINLFKSRENTYSINTQTHANTRKKYTQKQTDKQTEEMQLTIDNNHNNYAVVSIK